MPSLREKNRRVNHNGFGAWGGGPDPVIGRHQRSRLNGRNQGRVPPVWMFASESGYLAAARMKKTKKVRTWSISNGVAKPGSKNWNPNMFTTWYQHPAAETQHFVPAKFANSNPASLNGFVETSPSDEPTPYTLTYSNHTNSDIWYIGDSINLTPELGGPDERWQNAVGSQLATFDWEPSEDFEEALNSHNLWLTTSGHIKGNYNNGHPHSGPNELSGPPTTTPITGTITVSDQQGPGSATYTITINIQNPITE